MSDRLWMVFDVESIGLHGEGWAVGYVVVDQDGNTVGPDAWYVCPPATAYGDDEGRAWVAENCPPIPANCPTTEDVRRSFWRDWIVWKERGAVLVADCAWPVEARFLAACVDDDPSRTWEGPYPLFDVSSIRLAAGFDPLGDYPRLPNERIHDPLGDAKQSARLLVEALKRLSVVSAENGAGEPT